MSDKEIYEHKLVATKIICWSGVSALVCGALPIIAILAVFNLNMLWGGLISGAIVLVQFFALTMVWGHKKNQKMVETPLPPLVEESQENLQLQINDLKEQVTDLGTIGRVDRMIEARKVEV